MVNRVPDERKIRIALGVADTPCPDGCGLTEQQCEALREQLVARAITILRQAPQSTENVLSWLKAA